MVSLLLLLALTTGFEYRVQITDEGDRGSGTREARVLSDGTRFRIETEDPTFDVILSPDGREMIALHSQLQTWFTPRQSALALSSRFLTPGEGVAKKPRWTMTAAEGKRSGVLAYEVHGQHAIVDVEATIELTVDERLPRSRWPGSILPRTGYAAVDEPLAAADAAITAFPRRMELRVTRRYRGGPPMTASQTITVSEIRETAVDPSRFERPAEYRHQPPVMGVPGGAARE
jgi:hypothetical protein